MPLPQITDLFIFNKKMISEKYNKVRPSLSRIAILFLTIMVFVVAASIMANLAPVLTLLVCGLGLFMILAFKHLTIALWLMLISFPFTRDGLIIRLGIIDIHLIYLFELSLIIVWICRQMLARKKLLLPSKSVRLPIFLFIGAAVFSTLINGISPIAIRELAQLILNVTIVFIIFYTLKYTRLPVAKGIRIWLASICIVALVAIFVSLFSTRALPYIVIEPKGLDFVTTIETGQSILYTADGHTFYHRVELGLGAPYAAFPALLMIAALMSCSLLISRGKNRSNQGLTRYLWLFFIIFFVTLILTFTRSAWVGFLSGLSVLFILERVLRRWLPIAILLITILLVVPRGVVVRFNEIFGEESSKMGHLFLLCQAIEVIKKNPIWGVGFGRVGLYTSSDIDDQGLGRGVLHSAMAQLWAELGTVGLLAFVFILFSVLKSTIGTTRNIKRGNYNVEEASIARGLLAGLVALVVQAIFVPGLDQLFWLLLGLLLVVNKLLSSGTVELFSKKHITTIPHHKSLKRGEFL